MWLEAILTKKDLEEVVREFSPLEILLGDNGSLLLVAPCEVSLIPGEGIGVKCDATLRWPVLGFDVPVSMHALTVRILPRVEERPEGATLVFRLQIDHTGVSMLPSFFDDRVTARVNEELEQKHVELAWNFVETLSHVFALPPSLASSAAFSLKATAGKVKTTESALGLAVDFEAKVKPRAASVNAAIAQLVRPRPPRPSTTSASPARASRTDRVEPGPARTARRSGGRRAPSWLTESRTAIAAKLLRLAISRSRSRGDLAPAHGSSCREVDGQAPKALARVRRRSRPRRPRGSNHRRRQCPPTKCQ